MTAKGINNEVRPALLPYIHEQFGDTAEASIQYSISERKAAINVRLGKEKKKSDREVFSNLVTYLKDEIKLEHAAVLMIYTDENEEYIWNDDF
ncbi:hypothetical protein [Cytobacillus praedii]|uniref:hypothetical protein n=1 Tax=Cytobacillus praedii TaxID=1742358 RepID=UPI00070BE813|nr:hypothetical protein [Cytobacillus praedii]